MERLKSISCEQKLWDILCVYFMPTSVSNKQHTHSAAATPAAAGFHQRLKRLGASFKKERKRCIYLHLPGEKVTAHLLILCKIVFISIYYVSYRIHTLAFY